MQFIEHLTLAFTLYACNNFNCERYKQQDRAINQSFTINKSTLPAARTLNKVLKPIVDHETKTEGERARERERKNVNQIK